MLTHVIGIEVLSSDSDLAAAQIVGHSPDDETNRWRASLDEVMLERLAKVGLVPASEMKTLSAFIAEEIQKRKDMKPRTRPLYKEIECRLAEFLSPEKRIA